MKSRSSGFIFVGLIIVAVAIFAATFFIPNITSTEKLKAKAEAERVEQAKKAVTEGELEVAGETVSGEVLGTTTSTSALSGDLITHVTVPKAVKGVYMSSWVAGTPSLRAKIVKFIEDTEANSVIIDIKDYTGMVSFKPNSASVEAVGCIEERIRDIKPFIKELHEKNIYVIGRVAVFQDPCMVKKEPSEAVKRKSDGGIWKDDNGISWIDVGSKKTWQYNIDIAKASYALGFDEINFDYIRYPSDGNMVDIAFPVTGPTNKQVALEGFFKFIDQELRGGRATGAEKNTSTSTASRYLPASDPAFDELAKEFGLNISTTTASYADPNLDGHKTETTPDKAPRMIVSADLFGLVTNNNDDLGIGQVLERAIPYLDFVGPMVYPSHYPNNYMGYKNPAAYPYEIVKHAMAGGVAKVKAINLNPLKLRPWLQDFNLGATYTADMVRKQIKATYDVGLTGWMLWDASNTYTVGGVLPLQ